MLYEDNYLAHYGIIGQRWGIRRYQNEDGTLTEAGRKHYGYDYTKYTSARKLNKNLRQAQKEINKASSKRFKQRLKSNILMKKKQNDASIDDPNSRLFKKLSRYQGKINQYDRRIDNAKNFEDLILNKAFEEGNTRKLKRQSYKYGLNADWIMQKAKNVRVSDLAKEHVRESASPESDPKNSVFKSIRDKIEAMSYPEELRGKSKEEKKAWAQKEKDKFKESIQKDKEEQAFNKRLDNYDKLDEKDQESVRNEVKERIDKLNQKDGLTHDERKTVDGLADWYMSESDKQVSKVMEPLEKAYNRAHMLQDEAQVTLHDNPKYAALYKHVVTATKDANDRNYEAAGENRKNKNEKSTKGIMSKIKSSDANFKYWKQVSDTTLDYVKKNFPPEERDRALAFIVWNLYD